MPPGYTSAEGVVGERESSKLRSCAGPRRHAHGYGRPALAFVLLFGLQRGRREKRERQQRRHGVPRYWYMHVFSNFDVTVSFG